MSDDFDKLVVLLRWKRHEQPPPGYFVGFSRRVIAQLELDQATHAVSWWRRLIADFDAKPVLVGAYSVVVCGSLLYGMSLLGGAKENREELSFSQGIWSDSLAASAGIHTGVSLPPFSQANAAAFPLATGSLSPNEMPNASALFDGSLLKVQRAKASGAILNW